MLASPVSRKSARNRLARLASPLDTLATWEAMFASAPTAPTAMPIPSPAPTAPRTPRAEKQHAMRVEASAKHAALMLANAKGRDADRAARDAKGIVGKEATLEWSRDRIEGIRARLDGSLVTLVLARISANKRGNRVNVTGIATVTIGATVETVAIKGEATVKDIADASTLDGATVTVRLARAVSRTGEILPVFSGESVGVASTGQRIGVKARVTAGRRFSALASAL